MSLREVWYGGDGGTEAKQARTREVEFCDRVERARKEGKGRKSAVVVSLPQDGGRRITAAEGKEGRKEAEYAGG